MFDQHYRLRGLTFLLFLASAAWGDTTTGVTSKTGQNSNDSLLWSQLGADGTVLASSVNVSSVNALAVSVGLAGANSIASAVCPASPTCSWSGTGFAAADRILWTSDAAAGGNGPVTLTFGSAVSGAGALIQADEPGKFTAKIQAFNGSTLLGSFSVTSNTNGDAAYIGILDQTGPNITSVTFSLTACGSADVNCVLSDLALDTVFLDVPSSSSFPLTVTLAGTGTGSVSSSPSGITCPGTCSANFTSGSTVVLTAVAGSSSTFTGWSGACSGTGTCSVTMSAAKAVTATFNTTVTTFPLTVTLAGTGTGSVTSNPTGITCPGTCSANFTSGAAVVLTAMAGSGSTFAGWSGACTGTGTCGLTMSAAKAVTATFNSSGGPVVRLTPTSLNFGTVATGVTSAVKVVTLKNTGTATLTIASIAITGANSGDFLETSTTCTSSLAKGKSCVIRMQFKPTATGARSAAVSITDDAAGSPQQVPLSGTGTTAKLTPTRVNFGTVVVGVTSAVKKVTITNVGTTTLTLSSIAVTGTEAADFPETATTCGSSLAAAKSCTVSLTFKPSTTGSRSATLTVTDSAAGSPQQVTLVGTGG